MENCLTRQVPCQSLVTDSNLSVQVASVFGDGRSKFSTHIKKLKNLRLQERIVAKYCFS